MTFSSAYNPRPLEATFGYYNTSYSNGEQAKKMHSMINLINGLGYIPIIGTIMGIARIIFFGKFTAEHNNYYKNGNTFSRLQVARGVVEMLSLGAIFLIPDLISTINRELESALAKHGCWCWKFW